MIWGNKNEQSRFHRRQTNAAVFARGNRQRHARLLCDQLPFVRSFIVCAIRDDRAVVFGQLHDVAVFGLMADVMRGKARRWSESVISRELKCGRGELKFVRCDTRDGAQGRARRWRRPYEPHRRQRSRSFHSAGILRFSESDTAALQLSNNVSPILLLRAFAWLDCCSQ